MTDQFTLPDFSESKLNWWQIYSSKVRIWLSGFSWLQKITLFSWFFGLTISLLGLFWLNQAYQGLETDLANQLAELKQLQNSAVDNESSTLKTREQASTSSLKSSLTIHLAGAVKKPGIYNLPATSLLADGIKAAGGLSPDVWQDYLDQNINLAEPLIANQKIWIPKIDQLDLFVATNQCQNSQFNTVSENVTDASPKLLTEKISVNTASKTQLMELAGIGEKRADDIISNRPYVNVEELTSKAKVPASIVTVFETQVKFD